MKVLILSSFDIKGGAARAAFHLHQALRKIGLQSSMLVQQKFSDDPWVHCMIPAKGAWLADIRTFLDAVPTKWHKGKMRSLFSPAWLYSSRLVRKINESDADIVHLHWINNGFLRLEDIAKIEKPLVWTLHDMWAFTGGCHYDAECGKYNQSCGACPVLGSSNPKDLSSRVLRRKASAWENTALTILATSNWLADCARSSTALGNCNVQVLPNSIDDGRYKPIDRTTARKAFGLPLDKKLILFSAVSADKDHRKGMRYLLPALEKVISSNHGNQIQTIILGASEFDENKAQELNAHYIGYLNDDISQVLLYSAADLVVAPSLQENLSNTVMESLACGTPVVAFNIGGMPDMIEHQVNGYLVDGMNANNLSEGIAWVLADDGRLDELSLAARKSVLNRFGMEQVGHQYEALYQNILGVSSLLQEPLNQDPINQEERK